MSKNFDCVCGNMDILMYNNTVKKIKDVKQGDEVYSVQYSGDGYRYIRGEVTGLGRRKGKAVKITLADGRKLISSPNHQWLTQAGWHFAYDDETLSPGKVFLHEDSKMFGFTGKDIHYFAKIIHVADVYDALTTKRAYKDSMNPSDAIEYIMANNGTMFDIDVINTFLKYVAPYPIGCTVLLSSGQQGTVIENEEKYLARHKVKLGSGTVIDLMKKLDITILGILN